MFASPSQKSQKVIRDPRRASSRARPPKGLWPLVLGAAFASAGSPSNDPKNIVRAAVAAHGGAKLADADVTFTFRETRYRMRRASGRFSYERWIKKGGRAIHDVLNNEGFVRTVDGARVELLEPQRRAAANGVNSVVYFASLPLPLLDPAAQHRYAGTDEIRGVRYHLIQVTFGRKGGGDDHEDEFLYWVRQEDHYIDYLAYRFSVNGGGVRFRAAYDRRSVGGITFQHYRNYEHPDIDTDLKTLSTLFGRGKLRLLSKIETQILSVEASKIPSAPQN